MSFLTIDVGNTHISTGLFVGKRLVRAFKVPVVSDIQRFWPHAECQIGRERFEGITGVGISSVVAGKDIELVNSRFKLRDPHPSREEWDITRITRDTEWPLASAYESGLGTDRMLASVAAVRLHGKPVITVDIGSAVTVDLVDDDGVFRGGVILAGAGMRLRALAQFTSALPEVSIPDGPPPLIGRSTVACISSGIHHGMRQEILGLVAEIQRGIPGRAHVVLTGQGSRLFLEDRPRGWHIDEWLVLKGIRYVAQG